MTQLQEKYKYNFLLHTPVYRCLAMGVTSPLKMCAIHSTLRGIGATRLTQILHLRNLKQVNAKVVN